MMAIGLMILRKRPDIQRDYSIWGYPWVPLIFAVASFAIVLIHVVSNPAEAAFGLSLVAAGLPVYYVWISVTRRKEPAS
jgi:APA family basic amino acid/polyamine antiporter